MMLLLRPALCESFRSRVLIVLMQQVADLLAAFINDTSAATAFVNHGYSESEVLILMVGI